MKRLTTILGMMASLPVILIFIYPQITYALTASQVYERVKDAIVVVKGFDQAGKLVGLGSGVVLPSGDVVTNYHVFKSGVRHAVVREGKAVLANVKACDPKKDLCLFSAPGLVATPARLGQASRLKVGEPVYAVGAPQGLELSLSEGIVSQLRGGQPPIIQTTVAISQGSSGGGLFNAEAELVGIMTFYVAGGQSLNFAVPVEWVKNLPIATTRPGAREFNPDDYEPVVPAPGKKSYKDWSDKVAALERAKNWQGLLAHGHSWTRAEPDEAGAWVSLGIAYAQLGRHLEALEAFRKAHRLSPNNPFCLTSIGNIYAKLDRHQEAIQAFKEALRLDPGYASAWHGLGASYILLGRFKEAVEPLREALRLKPNDADAWHSVGVAYGQLGRFREAIESQREALRLKPDFAEAWHSLACDYAQAGNQAAALQAVKELRHYDPYKADKLFNLIMKP